MKMMQVGVGIALGVGIGAAVGVASGHVGLWLGIGVAIGILIGSHSGRNACPECASAHEAHVPAEPSSSGPTVEDSVARVHS